ncbi:MAG: helix-turn-helix transcriptional regulator [Ruminococcaceae bacterium]|nr:helix-turn-helix transcriptional regulator [Oscillospiraceae bacterium]
MQLNKAVAERIKELMNERNLTQYALHKLSGVPQSTLSTIINCRFPGMKLRIIYEICEGLEITLEEFFNSPLFSRENITD